MSLARVEHWVTSPACRWQGGSWPTDTFPGKTGHCLITSTTEGVRSDAPKPHCHQGRGGRGLTQGASGGGRRGMKAPPKGGPDWHPWPCPQALPSSMQRGLEDQRPARLCRHHTPGELKCSLLPRGKVEAQLPAWPGWSSSGGRWEFFPRYLAAVREGVAKRAFCC